MHLLEKTPNRTHTSSLSIYSGSKKHPPQLKTDNKLYLQMIRQLCGPMMMVKVGIEVGSDRKTEHAVGFEERRVRNLV